MDGWSMTRPRDLSAILTRNCSMCRVRRAGETVCSDRQAERLTTATMAVLMAQEILAAIARTGVDSGVRVRNGCRTRDRWPRSSRRIPNRGRWHPDNRRSPWIPSDLTSNGCIRRWRRGRWHQTPARVSCVRDARSSISASG